MAEKKQTSAAKAASGSKKKAPAQAKSTASAKKAGSKPSAKVKTEYDGNTSVPMITACVSLLLFAAFLLISINPEGVAPKLVQSIALGLVGKAGFYLSIPAFLYLFVINAFGRKTKYTMRSICVGVFVLCVGAIYHLAVQKVPGGSIVDLYVGGGNGVTGGVICGGLAIAVRVLLGPWFSYILLGVGAVLTLLGAMEITIPSIIRAIANRPREEREPVEEKPYVEPATMVVNHIANRQMEHRRQQRAKQAARNLPPEPAAAGNSQSGKPAAPAPSQPVQQPPQQPEIPQSATPSRGADVMNTINLDIEAPLGGTPVKPVTVPEPVIPDEPELIVPEKMPELKLDSRKEEPARKVPVEKVKPPRKPAAEEAPAPAQPEKITAKDTAESAAQVAGEIASRQADEQPEYCFPPIDLLKRPVRSSADGTDEMRENSQRLNEALASFRIDAHIINVTRGPSVTRYEVELDKGVRLNKLTGCADDIALSLGASGVRIAAVPGKISVVGIEVPNKAVTTVSLREVIDSPEFARAKSKSSFSVGKDIGGNCIVGNIARMPHMLIAGTTGSGKSVCMNSIIISLLYKSGPEDVKLIMVDPKMVELGIYNGIPHLLIPVVTDPKKAAGSLQWAVSEMMRRYKLMSDVGVRDLESYNSIVAGEEDGQKLPQVVVIIDELADLMLVAAKEVEDSICRIAQMGRAAGMHLIIATQRPSADVITGLMKANIPSRIAFSVASAMESRIILDTQGAEKLVGKGDMLYAPIGCGKPMRIQGCFVTDSEVEAVANYVKAHSSADYSQDVIEEINRKAEQTGKGGKPQAEAQANAEELDGDEMLPAAVDIILETKQASVSMLQRRLKLGYARAARIVDEMEEKGIVGPFQGSKPREILITKEQWAAMRGGSQMSLDDPEMLEEFADDDFT